MSTGFTTGVTADFSAGLAAGLATGLGGVTGFVADVLTAARLPSTDLVTGGLDADGLAGDGLDAAVFAVLVLVFAEAFEAGRRADAPGLAVSRAGLALRAAFFLLLAIGGQYTPEFRRDPMT